jgi:ClpP class serine protease
MHDHVRALGHVDKLDVFIYSRGGAIDVPWRLATALRGTADEWNVLVPFRANSAATLLALGADEIVLGRQGELVGRQS